MSNLITAEIKQSFIEINGIQLFFEELGKGEPILMIPGLGAGSWLWRKSLDLADEYHLIMPHLRGSGRSDKPDHRYSVKQFSDDINCLMEHLNLNRFHLIGVSLGGFVAQALSAQWPEKVQSLLLVCTSAGGDKQVGPDGYTLSRMIRLRGKTRDERLMDAYKLNFTEKFLKNHPDEIDAITSWRIQYPQPEFAYYRQLLAGSSYSGNNLDTLDKIPTLIMGGKEDTMVPPQDIKILQESIPGSELVMFEGKHLFIMEQSESFNKKLIGFLHRHVIMETQDVHR